MNILFIHQNVGQLRRLATYFANNPTHKVAFITARRDINLPGVRSLLYEHPKPAVPSHPYLKPFEDAVRYGQQVARSLIKLVKEGFKPDVVVVHPGWGEALYLKDVLPDVKVIDYCEYFYRPGGSHLDFDPEVLQPKLDKILQVRTKGAHGLLCIESSDAGVAPTRWQRDTFPAAYRKKIEVIHDGIDVAQVAPDPSACLTFNDQTFSAGEKVVTFVSRTLEPMRGFLTFMRSIPTIQQLQPDARIIIVGKDKGGYGAGPSKEFDSWRGMMEAEVPFDRSKVHFASSVPYPEFLKLLQVSAAHVYLTYPFVLSWSFLEALSAGALVLGSNTAPVLEILEHDKNGLVVDFFDPISLGAQVSEVLDHPSRYQSLREAARQTVLENYTHSMAMSRWAELIRRVA